MTSNPTPRTRLIAGGVVAAGLVIALIASLIGNGAPPRGPAPTWARIEAEPTLPAPTVGPTTAALTLAETHPFEAIRPAGDAALDAWGGFATSGDLQILGEMFHPSSPQLPLLQDMALEIVAAPSGGPAYALLMKDPHIEMRTSSFATIEGSVTATRGEGSPSETTWRLVMSWSEEQGSWMIWTIEEID